MAQNRLSNRAWDKPVIVYDGQEEMLAWASNQIGDCGPAATLGVSRNGFLSAVIIYFNYREPDIEIGLASVDGRWLNRSIIQQIFIYPFFQLKCNRITASVDASDPRIRRFLERLGFEFEGLKRKALPNGDAAIYGLLKENCIWLRGTNEITESA